MSLTHVVLYCYENRIIMFCWNVLTSMPIVEVDLLGRLSVEKLPDFGGSRTELPGSERG